VGAPLIESGRWVVSNEIQSSECVCCNLYVVFMLFPCRLRVVRCPQSFLKAFWTSPTLGEADTGKGAEAHVAGKAIGAWK
jgi:hypothetical protein